MTYESAPVTKGQRPAERFPLLKYSCAVLTRRTNKQQDSVGKRQHSNSAHLPEHRARLCIYGWRIPNDVLFSKK